MGTLTRRVADDRVVSAVPPRRGKPKLPREPKTPRVVELLRKAIEWQALLDSGEASNQAAIARREGITRARVTQVMESPPPAAAGLQSINHPEHPPLASRARVT